MNRIILSFLIALLGLTVMQSNAQQLTINIRYTGENGSGVKSGNKDINGKYGCSIPWCLRSRSSLRSLSPMW